MESFQVFERLYWTFFLTGQGGRCSISWSLFCHNLQHSALLHIWNFPKQHVSFNWAWSCYDNYYFCLHFLSFSALRGYHVAMCRVIRQNIFIKPL